MNGDGSWKGSKRYLPFGVGVQSSGTTTTNKYYYQGASRIAERVITTGSTVYFILSDQISSTSFITNASGTWVGSYRYMPWGGQRQTSGTIPITWAAWSSRETPPGFQPPSPFSDQQRPKMEREMKPRGILVHS